MPIAVWATITPIVGSDSFTSVATIGPSRMAVRAVANADRGAASFQAGSQMVL